MCVNAMLTKKQELLDHIAYITGHDVVRNIKVNGNHITATYYDYISRWQEDSGVLHTTFEKLEALMFRNNTALALHAIKSHRNIEPFFIKFSHAEIDRLRKHNRSVAFQLEERLNRYGTGYLWSDDCDDLPF